MVHSLLPPLGAQRNHLENWICSDPRALGSHIRKERKVVDRRRGEKVCASALWTAPVRWGTQEEGSVDKSQDPASISVPHVPSTVHSTHRDSIITFTLEINKVWSRVFGNLVGYRTSQWHD